jgi:hypothetical protein
VIRNTAYQSRIGKETTSRGFKNVADLREKSKRAAGNHDLVGPSTDGTT